MSVIARLIDPLTRKRVLDLDNEAEGHLELNLNGELTLSQLRLWISNTLLEGARPKTAEHGQLLDFIEMAMCSPGLRCRVVTVTGQLVEYAGWVNLARQLGAPSSHG